MNETAASSPMWIGPWIHSPFFEHTLNQMSLSAELTDLVRAFHRDGIVHLPGFIESEIVESVRHEIRGVYQENGGCKEQDLWLAHPAVRALAIHPKIKTILRTLYGREPFAFQTLNFKFGTEQRLHSDFIHFSSLPEGFMCGVWVALEDITEDNGPLVYYPGSQRLPLFDYQQIGAPQPIREYSAYEKFIAKVAESSGLPRKEIRAKKGDAFIWAANLLHGGSAIRKPGSTRWSQVTHYYFENCIYYTPMLSNRISGELCLRAPVNIETLQCVIPNYNGLPLTVQGFRGFEQSRIGLGENSTPTNSIVSVEFKKPGWLAQLKSQFSI